MRPLYWIAMVLAIIGAINWGLVGLFQFNLVGALFGELSPLSRLIYILVGLAGLVLIYFWAVTASESRPGTFTTEPQ